MSDKQKASLNNVITLDFKLAKPTKGMKKIASMQASAAAAGVKMLWVGTKLDESWVKWGKTHAC